MWKGGRELKPSTNAGLLNRQVRYHLHAICQFTKGRLKQPSCLSLVEAEWSIVLGKQTDEAIRYFGPVIQTGFYTDSRPVGLGAGHSAFRHARFATVCICMYLEILLVTYVPASFR